jgi:hypothetical protein
MIRGENTTTAIAKNKRIEGMGETPLWQIDDDAL